jgi:hypothetical protein
MKTTSKIIPPPSIRPFLLVLFGTVLLCSTEVRAQARGSIGLGAGINVPLASGFVPGSTWVLQTSARLSNRFALTPALGIEHIKSDKKGRYNGYYFEGSGRGVSLLTLNLSTRYYINRTLYVTAGPTLYVGGEDASSSGLAGTAGFGYDLKLDRHNNLELLLHADAVPDYGTMLTVAGLRLLYKFNFRGL